MDNPVEIAYRAIRMEALAVSIYSKLAERKTSGPENYLRIAERESSHLSFWTGFLRRRRVEAKVESPNPLKVAAYGAATRLLGSGLTLRMMERAEAASISLYADLLSSTGLDEAERRGIQEILEDELVHEEEFIRKQLEMGDFLSYIKDAVLGLNDGLVEILSVTTGLAGVYGSPYAVALGGIVVGVAGALSMGMSTFTSTRSQRQVHEGILGRLASASRHVTKVFKDRVIQHTLSKGYSVDVAGNFAEETISDPKRLSDFIAEEEYGLSEESLGNPGKAALYAGGANLAGALIPLFPYFFAHEVSWALFLSLTAATVFLIATALLVSLVANTSARAKVLEMVMTGLGSATVTYMIGWLASMFLGTRTL